MPALDPLRRSKNLARIEAGWGRVVPAPPKQSAYENFLTAYENFLTAYENFFANNPNQSGIIYLSAMEKKCSSCKKTKPISEFYKNRTTHDGHDNICRECRRSLYQPRKARTHRLAIEDIPTQELLDELRRRQEQTPNS